jgi:cysteinyl-tRNA synthetase
MTLFLYDTFSKSKREFRPIDPKNIRMYVCGPTVYDYAHVGNARPVIVFDTLFRIMRHSYGVDHVTYVRNITDIDDKIIEAANSNKEDISSLTSRTIQYFHEDASYIGALVPTIEPKATDHIKEMVEMIETLIVKGFAYEVDGNVLFSSSKYDQYGKLSGKNIDELIAGARVDIEDFKKEASDFILWKPSKDNEPGWESPWGKGRPGWHIECSAMSKKYLGDTFDIHGGGQDLIFPHHENEIAQSECCHEKKFANYWLHNGFLTVEGNKMAKSNGNFITVNELKDRYHGEVIRLAMLMTHYRQPLNWTENSLLESKKILNKWFSFFLDIEISKVDEDFVDESILSALKDDINTPKAISELHQLFKNCTKEDVLSIKKFINSARLLGLMLSSPKEWMEWNVRENNLDEIKINELIEKRNLLRDQGNYSDADKIRDQLDELEIILEDKDGKTTWKQKN